MVSHEPLGSKTVVYMHPDGNSDVIIKSVMGSGYKPKPGEIRELVFEEKDVYLFDRETEELVLRFSS